MIDLISIQKEGVSITEINLCLASQYTEDFVVLMMGLLDEALDFKSFLIRQKSLNKYSSKKYPNPLKEAKK